MVHSSNTNENNRAPQEPVTPNTAATHTGDDVTHTQGRSTSLAAGDAMRAFAGAEGGAFDVEGDAAVACSKRSRDDGVETAAEEKERLQQERRTGKQAMVKNPGAAAVVKKAGDKQQKKKAPRSRMQILEDKLAVLINTSKKHAEAMLQTDADIIDVKKAIEDLKADKAAEGDRPVKDRKDPEYAAAKAAFKAHNNMVAAMVADCVDAMARIRALDKDRVGLSNALALAKKALKAAKAAVKAAAKAGLTATADEHAAVADATADVVEREAELTAFIANYGTDTDRQLRVNNYDAKAKSLRLRKITLETAKTWWASASVFQKATGIPFDIAMSAVTTGDAEVVLADDDVMHMEATDTNAAAAFDAASGPTPVDAFNTINEEAEARHAAEEVADAAEEVEVEAEVEEAAEEVAEEVEVEETAEEVEKEGKRKRTRGNAAEEDKPAKAAKTAEPAEPTKPTKPAKGKGKSKGKGKRK